MSEEEEKAIDRLKYINMAYDCNNYYSKYDLDCIKTLLQLLEQKDNKINKVIDKLKLFKNDLKAYEDVRNNHYVPIGAVGIRINELLKILEE